MQSLLAEACNDRLLVIRHGETVWNAEHRFTTRSDVRLSDVGIRQAEAGPQPGGDRHRPHLLLAAAARATNGDTIAASQAALVPVEVDPRLTEIDAGPFDGKTTEELRPARWPRSSPAGTRTATPLPRRDARRSTMRSNG